MTDSEIPAGDHSSETPSATDSAGPHRRKKSGGESDLSDSQLIGLIRSGKTEYFNELVNRYENHIFQYTFRMCGNEADAEDVLQETFLNAFRAIDTFRGDAKLTTWLYRIANNSCLMKRRKSKFAPDQEISLSDFPMEQDFEPDGILMPPPSSPVKNLLNHEFREILQRLLLELPKHYRQAFVLADIQGFSGQEIAEILGISIPTVKSRLHRARVFLRNRLSTYVDIEMGV